ncbi:MAG: TetR/AcrR family transcriptional regulator [Desulfovibrionaceae bacterium]|nr:TetR/AcrR family transcriptional regulator [Desulfovibrionaceae bacterium]
MSRLKVVPIRSREIAKNRLIRAVGRVLAREGFARLGVSAVAREAGLDRSLVYRYFGGLKALVAAYGQSAGFWPTAEELLAGEGERIRGLGPGRLMGLFFRRYLEAILRRPETLDILAWEAVERNDLTRGLEAVRAKTALEFFEHLEEDPPAGVDLTALVLILYAAANFLAVRSRLLGHLGGVDLASDEGWERVKATMDLILDKTLG